MTICGYLYLNSLGSRPLHLAIQSSIISVFRLPLISLNDASNMVDTHGGTVYIDGEL